MTGPLHCRWTQRRCLSHCRFPLLRSILRSILLHPTSLRPCTSRQTQQPNVCRASGIAFVPTRRLFSQKWRNIHRVIYFATKPLHASAINVLKMHLWPGPTQHPTGAATETVTIFYLANSFGDAKHTAKSKYQGSMKVPAQQIQTGEIAH